MLGPRLRSPIGGALGELVAGPAVCMGQFRLGQRRSRPLLADLAFIASGEMRRVAEPPSLGSCGSDALAVLRVLESHGPRDLAATVAERPASRARRDGAAGNTDYACLARCRWTASRRWEHPVDGAGDAASGWELSRLRRAGLRADEGRWYAVAPLVEPAEDEATHAGRCRARVMALMINSPDPAAVHLSVVKPAELPNRAQATRYLAVHRGALVAVVDRHPGEGRFFRARDVRFVYPEGADARRRAALRRRVALAMLEYAVRWEPWEAVRIGASAMQSSVDGREDATREFIDCGLRLSRGEMTYRLRRRAGAESGEAMRRVVPTEEQRPEDVGLTSRPVLDFYRHVMTEYESLLRAAHGHDRRGAGRGHGSAGV